MHTIAFIVAAVGLLFVPGTLLTVATLPSHLQRWWVVLPLAPLVSLGSSFSVAVALEAAGLEVHALSTLVVVAAATLVVVVARRHRLAWREWRADRREVIDILGVGAIAAVTLYAWVHARGGHLLLPNYDGVNHALFVRRILEESTLDPLRVSVQDPFTDFGVSEFYPFALHLTGAQLVRMATSSIPTALFALTALIASVSWPAGLYAVARRLLPWRWAPLITAALGATMLQFPYKPISWGGLTSIVGISLVPGLIALGLALLRDSDRDVLPVFSFALGALFVTHTSQVPATLFLLVTLGAADLFRRQSLRLLEARTLVFSFIAFLIPTWGVLGDFFSGSEERANVPSFFDSVAGLIGPIVTLSVSTPRVTVLPALFLLGGIIASFALRIGRTVVLAWAVFAALVIVAGIDEWWTSPFRVLTSPWYGQYERVSYYLVIPVAMLGAIALCALSDVVASWHFERGRARRVWTTATSAIVCATVVAIAVANTRNFVGATEKEFAYWQRIDENMLHVGDLTTIASTEPVQILALPESAAMWLYVLDPRLEPVGPFLSATPTSADLRELAGRLPNATHDPWVDEQLDRFSIDYVFINNAGMNGEPAQPPAEALRSNPCFELVFESGSTGLWKVC